MSAIAERHIEKHRRRFSEAAAAIVDELTEAALKAAVHVIQAETGIASSQGVRAQLKREATALQTLDGSGSLVSSILRSALPDPWLPEAFDVAVYSVGKLLCTAWNAGVNR